MGVLQKHIAKSYQIKYLKVFLATRTFANTYNSYVDVTRYILDSSIGSYKRSIDSNDFDIGYQEESNISVNLDNNDGRFLEGLGFFEEALVDRSKIKIEAGYVDTETFGSDSPSVDYQVSFEGIIDDRATSYDEQKNNVQFTIVSFSSIINRLKADASFIVNGDSFQSTLFNLLNVADIRQLLTVDIANINPKVNSTVTDVSWFQGKQLKEAMEAMLLASNSVLVVKNGAVYVKPRAHSTTPRFRFYGKGSAKPSNIEKISNYNNGLARVITRAYVNSTVVEGDFQNIIRRYGARVKNINLGFISNNAIETAIGEDIIDEFSIPKTEFELTTDYLGNEVDLLDTVTVENEGFVLDAEPALYGEAIYGESTYVQRSGSLKISPHLGFKIIAINHDYKRFSTTLKLRAIGNKAYDNVILGYSIDPLDIDGLQLWFDANDPATMTIAESGITEWRDKSGNEYNVAELFDPPQYVLDSGWNGKHVVRFDGVAQRLIRNEAMPLLRDCSGRTVFTVWSRATTGSAASLLWISKNVDDTERHVVTPSSTNIRFSAKNVDANASDTLSAASFTAGDVIVQTDWVDQTQTLGVLYKNGIEIGRDASFLDSSDTSDTDSANLVIGADTQASPTFFDGDIAEILVYNRALTDAERAQVETYLKDKWGL